MPRHARLSGAVSLTVWTDVARAMGVGCTLRVVGQNLDCPAIGNAAMPALPRHALKL